MITAQRIVSITPATPGWRIVTWCMPEGWDFRDRDPGVVHRAADSEITLVSPVAAWALCLTDDGCDTPYLVACFPDDFPHAMSIEPEDHPWRIAYLGPDQDVDAEIAREARRKALVWLAEQQES